MLTPPPGSSAPRRERAQKLGGLGFTYTWEKFDHERGPIRSILRMRKEDRKRLLEGGCSAIERLLIEQGIL
jgi:hypothetical protein